MTESPCRIATLVAEDIRVRSLKGLEKYGVTVYDNDLSLKQWLQHAYEEALDFAVYLRKIIEMQDEK